MHKASYRGNVLFFAAGWLVLACPLGSGLLHAMQATAPLLHPAGATRPEFEVATIKPSNRGGLGLGYQLSPTGFKASDASLKDLIQFAYVMKSGDQLVGAPKWAHSEFFDIQAKYFEADIQAAKQIPMDKQMRNIRLRVQSLLADRFQLKTHFETRKLPVYALVVARGGIKMREVEVDPPPSPGTPPQPNANSPQFRETAANQFTATAWPVNEMTVWLSHFDELGGRIVVNETGLTGHYDWVLNGVSMRSTPDEPTASIFTALQDQLGLRLEPRKDPVEVLVIDHVEQPSPN